MFIGKCESIERFVSNLESMIYAIDVKKEGNEAIVDKIKEFINANAIWIEIGKQSHNPEMGYCIDQLAKKIKKTLPADSPFVQELHATAGEMCLPALMQDIWKIILKFIPESDSDFRALSSVELVSKNLKILSDRVKGEMVEDGSFRGFATKKRLDAFLGRYKEKFKILDLNGVQEFLVNGDVDFYEIIKRYLEICPNIEELYCRGILFLTVEQIKTLRELFPKVKTLSVCKLQGNGKWTSSRQRAFEELKDLPDGYYRLWPRATGEKGECGIMIKAPGKKLKVDSALFIRKNKNLETSIKLELEKQLKH